MRRLLGILACLAGMVWGGMVGWAVNRPETQTRVRVRTAAFCVMIGSAMLMPASRRKEDEPPEEW